MSVSGVGLEYCVICMTARKELEEPSERGDRKSGKGKRKARREGERKFLQKHI